MQRSRPASPHPSPHPALPRTEPPNLGLQGGAWVGVANGVRCPRKGRPESPVHPHPWAWLGHNLGNFSAVWVLDCRRPPVQRRGLGSPPRVMLPAREGPCQGLGPLERPSGGGAQPWNRQPRGTCPRPSHFQSPYTLRESRGPTQKEAAEAGELGSAGRLRLWSLQLHGRTSRTRVPVWLPEAPSGRSPRSRPPARARIPAPPHPPDRSHSRWRSGAGLTGAP